MTVSPTAISPDERCNSTFSRLKSILSIVSVRELAVSRRINGGRHGINLESILQTAFSKLEFIAEHFSEVARAD